MISIKRIEHIENEIENNHKAFSLRYNIKPKQNPNLFKKEKTYILLSELQEKYGSVQIDKDKGENQKSQTDDVQKMISISFNNLEKNLRSYREEQDLRTYVENCHHYGLQKYLNIKSYNDKKIRNYVMNTNLLEFEDKCASPNFLLNIQMEKSNFRDYKNLGKEKEEHVNSSDQDYNEKVEELNYLAETKFIQKMNELNEISTNNKNCLLSTPSQIIG